MVLYFNYQYCSCNCAVIIGDLGGNIIAFGTLIPTLAVAVRRVHDVGKSGWFILVPIYNIILFVTPSKGTSFKL
ncbi:MAG: DUF805 domain-containing protein [Candidatus Nanopelagicus sp.]